MQCNFHPNKSELSNPQGKVKVTDLLSRLNEEKKIERKKKFSSRSSSCIRSNGLWYYINNINKKLLNSSELPCTSSILNLIKLY